jgi:hypothetical protein
MIRERRGKSENNYVRLCRSMASKGCDQLRHLSESTPAKSDLEGVKLQQRVARARVSTCKLLEFNGLSRPIWIRERSLLIPEASALRIDGHHRVTRNGQVNSALRVTGASGGQRLPRGVRAAFFLASPL